MFMIDYYLPQARLVFELNGNDHFYPYTYKKNNVTDFKSKLLREWHRRGDGTKGYSLLNLNAKMLHGLSKEPEKLEDFLKRQITTALNSKRLNTN